MQHVKDSFWLKTLSSPIKKYLNYLLLLLLVFLLLIKVSFFQFLALAPFNIMKMIFTFGEMHRVKYYLTLYSQQNESVISDRIFQSYLVELKKNNQIFLVCDAWKNDYVYYYDQSHGKIYLSSSGPDGKVSTEDDLRLAWKIRSANEEE